MADLPTLYVHIGGGKCGSSAIQSFLAANAAQLRSQGVLVPGCDLTEGGFTNGGQIAFFEDLANRGLVRDQPTQIEVRQRLRRLIGRGRAGGLRAVVLSAENLINPQAFATLFPPRPDYRIQVVAYVRRQDDFLASAWQQWQLKVHPSFDAYYRSLTQGISWARLLEPWRSRYGAEQMTVSVYGRGQLHRGSVVEDFARIIDVDTAGCVIPGLVNRTLHERYGELANRHRTELFESIHDNDFYLYLERVLGENAFRSYEGSALLTLEQRRRIMADHREANEELRGLYFPDRREVFNPPTTKDIAAQVDLSIDPIAEQALVQGFLLHRRSVDGAPEPPVATPKGRSKVAPSGVLA